MAVRPKPSRARRLFGEQAFALFLFLPATMILAIVVVYPLFRTFTLSLFQYSLITPWSRPFVGAGNYLQALRDPVFWQALGNTLLFNLVSVIVGFGFGFVMALLLNTHTRLRGLLRGLATTPWIVPYVVIGFLAVYMFNTKMGVVNYLLQKLGFIREFLPWMSDPLLAFTAVTLANVWNQFPFHMVTLLAGLQTIPEELREAARIDGANSLQVFLRITLPWLRNIIAISTSLMFIQNFNNFALIWSMTQGGPVYATTTLVIYVYRKAFREFDFGLASAVGMIWLALLVFVIWGYTRLVEREGYTS